MFYPQGGINLHTLSTKRWVILSISILILFFLPAIFSHADSATSLSKEPDESIVDASGKGDYVSLEQAIQAQATHIYIRNGIYDVNTTLQIDLEDTIIRGQSRDGVVLRQTQAPNDLVVIRADRVHISNLTLDTYTYNAGATLVVADANQVIVQDSLFKGSERIFAVYFAGPSVAAGQDTLAAVESGTLDDGNQFLRNEVYSHYAGDGLSFSLQKNGLVQHNTLHNAVLAFYMCRNSEVSNNLINDSPGVGIHYSMPAYDNIIRDNEIYRSLGSGIRASANLEHPVPTTALYEGLLIEHNIIKDTRSFGIELDQVGSRTRIQRNTIRQTDFSGIIVLRSYDLRIHNNQLSNNAYYHVRGKIHDWTGNSGGIDLENTVTATKITYNTITSNGKSDFGIRFSPIQGKNTIYKNKLVGTTVMTDIIRLP
ncbi:competence protein ComGC [Paenibacillus sp. SORGH_AS306]|uniref:right-handed parallel beta-helix repeat-containing protein n=1 Tax=unclassified Paenibacillus TaxID=185978 RepID=UPI002787D0F5|nr:MULTISPECIES: right-handed parallel beta-helix repeat-containing protein [unclassified Paenibacillus]MDQ1236289.1 competence protein ComGC [Paenibacillus sp. SORGH_AS_0306]MDR6108643.1 competence protein ComGC [Paenibacillus sp. SORGH_AS_0338]